MNKLGRVKVNVIAIKPSCISGDHCFCARDYSLRVTRAVSSVTRMRARARDFFTRGFGAMRPHAPTWGKGGTRVQSLIIRAYMFPDKTLPRIFLTFRTFSSHFLASTFVSSHNEEILNFDLNTLALLIGE